MINKITQLYSKFENIISWADDISGIGVKETEDRRPEHMGASLYRCRDKVKKLLESEETAFLAAFVIEHYWNLYRPAIVIPAEEILAGNMSKIDELRDFQKEIDNNPAKSEWKELSQKITETASACGYHIDHPNFNDLSAIVDIVYDALTIHTNYYSKVYRFKTGKRSKNKPILFNEIGIFSSEAEVFRFFENIQEDAFVAFVGIEKTNAQTNNYFDDWLYDRDNERTRNGIYNNSMSKEEFMSSKNPHSRCIYTVIRDGDNIYMDVLPVQGNGYGPVWQKTNSYGYRTSYGPTQIFWENVPPPCEEGSSALIPAGKKRWKLSEIIDQEQQIWLPLYFTKTIKMFFTDNISETLIDVYLPEEILMSRADNNTLVTINMPAIVYDTYTIPEPEEVFTDEMYKKVKNGFGNTKDNEKKFKYSLELCNFFGITSADLSDIPIRYEYFGEKRSAFNEMNDRAVKAYQKLIGQKLATEVDKRYNDEASWYKDRVSSRFSKIIDKALLGKYEFAETRIDKRPVLNEDGTQKMRKKHTWSSDDDLEPVLEHTSIDEGKIIRSYWAQELRYWLPETLVGKHPPVVLHIHPETPEQIAEICECSTSELPFLIKYHNIYTLFNLNRYITTRSIPVSIRVIYGKREYKQALADAQLRETV